MQNLIKQEEVELLIPGIKSGDINSTKKFYDLLGPLMKGICRRYLGDTDDADDAFIESITKAIDKIGTVRGGNESIVGWCRKIAINKSLNIIRRNKNKINFEDIDTLSWDDSPSINPEAIDNLDLKDMLKMIDGLPSGYRSVFNMYVIDGYTHKEISKILNIQEGTSRSQLMKARATLYSKLK